MKDFFRRRGYRPPHGIEIQQPGQVKVFLTHGIRSLNPGAVLGALFSAALRAKPLEESPGRSPFDLKPYSVRRLETSQLEAVGFVCENSRSFQRAVRYYEVSKNSMRSGGMTLG